MNYNSGYTSYGKTIGKFNEGEEHLMKEEKTGRGCFEWKYIVKKQVFRSSKFLVDDISLGAYNFLLKILLLGSVIDNLSCNWQ